ncbi:MAG: hypothetical protein IT285_05600 [Bdellovibrionales bacterium]|nr:hypothetical protein [Bdellovibrionales bacterium]
MERGLTGQAIPLNDRELCVAVWARLKRSFPGAPACVLMPDHAHLLAEGDPGQLRRRWARALSSAVRDASWRWEPFPLPAPIPNAQHLARQLRYLHLNPCRAGLCSDPLEWEWSTHRDWMGCVDPSWPEVERWGRILGWWGTGGPERMHRYVSSDPAVRVTGTPPISAGHAKVEECSVREVLRAVAASRRVTVDVAKMPRLDRRLVVKLAAECSGLRPVQIAARLGLTRQAAARILRRAPPSARARAAVLQVLSDPRTRWDRFPPGTDRRF